MKPRSLKVGRARRLLAALSVAATFTTVALGAPTGWAQASGVPHPVLGTRTANGSNPSQELKQLEAAAQAESKATFKITYISNSNGTNSTTTIEQKPPEQLLASGTGEVIFDGTKTYYCDDSSKPPKCTVYPSISESPMAIVIALYSSSTYITIMQGWAALIAAHLPGIKISFSRATFAHLPSECVTWSAEGNTAKYCVANVGILAYVGGTDHGKTSSTFTLSAYSSHVSSSDFKLPKGAKVSTVP
ncbi:MAG TPA: hypothetical protein VME46_04395 [Acidimicrobiales bacterium]|nr:hypothetical protein [Acidimicrobiales bacterium]